MPPKLSPHLLTGQGFRHGGPEVDKRSQLHYHHAEGSVEKGRPCFSHARRLHSTETALRRTLPRQEHNRRAKKTIRFKDSLKVSLKYFNISIESWESLAMDRLSWCHLIIKGAYAAEQHRYLQAEQKRTARKARATSTNSTLCVEASLLGLALSATHSSISSAN